MSTERIEELLEKPYWIIDILPEQVPADSAGQYFAVEEYFRRQPETKQKKINVILKINCLVFIQPPFHTPYNQTTKSEEKQ